MTGGGSGVQADTQPEAAERPPDPESEAVPEAATRTRFLKHPIGSSMAVLRGRSELGALGRSSASVFAMSVIGLPISVVAQAVTTRTLGAAAFGDFAFVLAWSQ